MSKNKLRVLSVKITEPLEDMINQFLEKDTHVTKSDFVRSAIREKIKRETPYLFEKMYRETEEK